MEDDKDNNQTIVMIYSRDSPIYAELVLVPIPLCILFTCCILLSMNFRLYLRHRAMQNKTLYIE